MEPHRHSQDRTLLINFKCVLGGYAERHIEWQLPSPQPEVSLHAWLSQ